MRVECSDGLMLLSASSKESNGRVYYTAGLYDIATQTLYNVDVTQDAFNALVNIKKPANFAKAVFELSGQYQFRCRMTLIAWS